MKKFMKNKRVYIIIFLLNFLSNFSTFIFSSEEEIQPVMLTKSDNNLLGKLTTLAQSKQSEIANVAQKKSLSPLDMIGKTNTILRAFAQTLQSAQSGSQNLTTFLQNLGINLYALANGQLASGAPFMKQKKDFLSLLEAGLVLQLILNYRLEQWKAQFNAESKNVIDEFVASTKKLVSNGLVILAKSYKNQADKPNLSTDPFLRAKLMLARILIYPDATISQSKSTPELEEAIALLQPEKDRAIFNDWQLQVAKNYMYELQDIFGKESL